MLNLASYFREKKDDVRTETGMFKHYRRQVRAEWSAETCRATLGTKLEAAMSATPREESTVCFETDSH